MVEAPLLTRFEVQLNGSKAPDEFMEDLDRITVESSLHLPSVATVVLFDPQLKWIDDADVWPGKKIVINHIVDRGATTPLFHGEIVEIEPHFEDSSQWLTIRAFDALHRLARGRHTKTFQNVRDSQIAQQVIQGVGLQADATSTTELYEHVWQANESDLDFLRRRAALNGYLLYADGMKICFKPPPADGTEVDVQWGVDLTEFRLCLSTTGQISEATVRGWNIKDKTAIVGQASSPNGQPELGESRTGGSVAQAAYGFEAKDLITAQPVPTQPAAQTLAQAHLDKRASRYIEASGTCFGNPKIVAGTKLKLTNLGNRFSGTYVVTSATHLYGPGVYITEFTVSSATSASLVGFMLPDESVQPVVGPVVGIVTDNNDPDGMGRVKVKYPWLSDDETAYWARLVSPGAGTDRGLQFLPEVNDEVLVNFDHGDINYPYVLGGMWNGQDGAVKKNAETLEAGKVKLRYIQTRAGHVIMLDDTQEKGGITIQDKAGDKIFLDNETGKGGITIQDKAGNKLVLDSMGQSITVQALQNLTLKAGAQVQIQGATVSVQASTGPVEVKGLTVNVEGQTATAVKGATVSVQGTAVVQVQGGLIKLN